MKTNTAKTKHLLLLLFSFWAIAASAQDELDNYIDRLKKSQATGGKETAFMSAGSDFLYGQGYFDSKQYDMAAMYFKYCVDKEPENPFFNYQYAVSLINQKDKYKTEQAQPFLQKALSVNPTLKTRFEKTHGSQTTATPPPAGAVPAVTAGGLYAYLDRLAYSRATGGKETSMNTAGRDIIGGYDYYQRGEFSSAATNFRLGLGADPDHVYGNYLLGVSLYAMGEQAAAQPHLAKAFAGDASLKQQFEREAPKAVAAHKKYEESRQIKYTPAAEKTTGGKLVYGNYACNQTVWNGPNASPAYRYIQKGYFQLRPDGTYRWLDNGATGRYSYDAKTGRIKWLSGHFAAAPPQSSVYQPGDVYAQITVNFSEDHRWECACKKK